MAQLTIYLDGDTERKARAAALREGKSLSKWARGNLDRAADNGHRWLEGYFELFGSISDPSFEIAEEPPWSADGPRENIF